MKVLETAGLTRSFGRFRAIDEVNFGVEEGERRGIIGPNGAGKTTLFNLLTGVLAPTAGTITFRGEEITTRPPHERVKLGIARAFQITNLLDGLTVRENVEIAVRSRYYDSGPSLSMLTEDDRTGPDADEVLEYVGIAELADQPATELSHGQKRKLEITLALATDPDLLLLDEPTAGIAPEDRAELVSVLRRVTEDSTVLLIEHDIDLISEVVDAVTVLNRGQILAEGTPAEVQSNADVQSAYLGGGTHE